MISTLNPSSKGVCLDALPKPDHRALIIWSADEANNAVAATVPSLGVGGLNSILFDGDDRFSAMDGFQDEPVNCERTDSDAQVPDVNVLPLAERLSNGEDTLSRTSLWSCGDISYTFLDDGTAILGEQDAETVLSWEASSAQGVIASGINGFVLQRIEFTEADVFTAMDFASGQQRQCQLQLLNPVAERLITGRSAQQIGDESWQCQLDSDPGLDLHYLFHADGQGVFLIHLANGLDGQEFSWQVSEDTGLLNIDGEELANFAMQGDERWAANVEGGTLSCERR